MNGYVGGARRPGRRLRRFTRATGDFNPGGPDPNSRLFQAGAKGLSHARVLTTGRCKDNGQFPPYERVTEGDEQYRRT